MIPGRAVCCLLGTREKKKLKIWVTENVVSQRISKRNLKKDEKETTKRCSIAQKMNKDNWHIPPTTFSHWVSQDATKKIFCDRIFLFQWFPGVSTQNEKNARQPTLQKIRGVQLLLDELISEEQLRANYMHPSARQKRIANIYHSGEEWWCNHFLLIPTRYHVPNLPTIQESPENPSTQ